METTTPHPRPMRLLTVIRSWVDSHAPATAGSARDPDSIEWARVIPFALLHLGCLLVLVVGFSPAALVLAVVAYAVRMFAITAFYHRYFAHRAFRASRLLQFVFAFLGNSSGQRGPLWWAAHHRRHHKHSDTERDSHSPHERGVMWSHVFWFMSRRNFATDLEQVPDLARFPELRFLDRFDILAPLCFALSTFAIGAWLAHAAPELGIDGSQALVWGFFVSTTVLFHGTSTINSLGHLFGRRRYATRDHSRNSFLLALLTFGEGWHNNHHFYPVAARQGFFWWEVDLTYYLLRAMRLLGLVWDLKPVPLHVRNGDRVRVRERR